MLNDNFMMSANLNAALFAKMETTGKDLLTRGEVS